MNAKLYLKSGSFVAVQGLKVIRQQASRRAIEISDFTNFFYSPTYCYSFVGEHVVTVWGDNLLYVEFN